MEGEEEKGKKRVGARVVVEAGGGGVGLLILGGGALVAAAAVGVAFVACAVVASRKKRKKKNINKADVDGKEEGLQKGKTDAPIITTITGSSDERGEKEDESPSPPPPPPPLPRSHPCCRHKGRHVGATPPVEVESDDPTVQQEEKESLSGHERKSDLQNSSILQMASSACGNMFSYQAINKDVILEERKILPFEEKLMEKIIPVEQGNRGEVMEAVSPKTIDRDVKACGSNASEKVMEEITPSVDGDDDDGGEKEEEEEEEEEESTAEEEDTEEESSGGTGDSSSMDSNADPVWPTEALKVDSSSSSSSSSSTETTMPKEVTGDREAHKARSDRAQVVEANFQRESAAAGKKTPMVEMNDTSCCHWLENSRMFLLLLASIPVVAAFLLFLLGHQHNGASPPES